MAMFEGAMIMAVTSCIGYEHHRCVCVDRINTYDDRRGMEERLVVVEQGGDDALENVLAEDGETLVIDAFAEEAIVCARWVVE